MNAVGGGEPWSRPAIPVIGGTAKLALPAKFDKERLETAFANRLRHFIGAPMHTGSTDNAADFWLCVRTVTLDPFRGFVYRRMNWHTEHHMFAAVPCCNPSRLHGIVAFDMPKPRTPLGASLGDLAPITLE